MSDTDFPAEIFDDFDQEIPIENFPSNKRIAVRYRRKDIKAVVKVHSLLYPRLLPVIIRDISSKGAGLISEHKVNKRSRVSLFLLFDDGKRFEIDAVVVHSDNHQKFGLKFKCYNDDLAEHLLLTQTDLTFS